MKLSGKVAVITGGTSGIGKAIAETFTREGAAVAIASRKETELGSVDVSDEASIERFVKRVVSKYQHIDILVNSAGIYIAGEDNIEGLPLENAKKVLDVNFFGTLSMIKHCLPQLKQSKGCVINISSSIGTKPDEEASIYCASKAAVNMITKSIALTYAKDGVRINAIAPGPIDTPMLNKNIPNKEDMDSYIHSIPLKRAGKPEEVAELALFLATNQFATGGIYPLDGGETLT